jgi:hypothetical protein
MKRGKSVDFTGYWQRHVVTHPALNFSLTRPVAFFDSLSIFEGCFMKRLLYFAHVKDSFFDDAFLNIHFRYSCPSLDAANFDPAKLKINARESK